MANKKDRPVNFDLKFGNLCKAVKYHWLLPSIWNQEGSTEENLNYSKNIFFVSGDGIIFNAGCRHLQLLCQKFDNRVFSSVAVLTSSLQSWSYVAAKNAFFQT